jgi:molybdopterin synthase sulfur carrier subunit
MKINILAFGIIREIFNANSMLMELPEKATTNDLKDKLEARFPPLKELASCLIAVNDEYADDDQVLHPEDEIAIIPPVSGG